MYRNKSIQTLTIILCSSLLISPAVLAAPFLEEEGPSVSDILEEPVDLEILEVVPPVEEAPPEEKSSSSSSNDALIIGGAVILIAVIYYMFKKKDQASAMNMEDIQSLNHGQISKNMSFSVDPLLIDSPGEGISTDELSVDALR